MANTVERSPFNDIVQVLVRTAMRRGEAANLQPRDLDFEASTITVRGEVSKTRQSRTIPMADALVPILRERARGVAEDGYIFGDGSNFARPFNNFSKKFPALASVDAGRRLDAARRQADSRDAIARSRNRRAHGRRSARAFERHQAAASPASTIVLRPWSARGEAIEAWSTKLAALTALTAGVLRVCRLCDSRIAIANIVQLKRKVT